MGTGRRKQIAIGTQNSTTAKASGGCINKISRVSIRKELNQLMLEGYREQFGNRLEKFENQEVPEALASLNRADRKLVANGEGGFPKDILNTILESNDDQQQKIHKIVAITGTWMIASSEARWAIGPIEESPYAERVGIGIENPNAKSFTPLLAQAEELVLDASERSANLDLLAAFAEYDKRQSAKP